MKNRSDVTAMLEKRVMVSLLFYTYLLTTSTIPPPRIRLLKRGKAVFSAGVIYTATYRNDGFFVSYWSMRSRISLSIGAN